MDLGDMEDYDASARTFRDNMNKIQSLLDRPPFDFDAHLSKEDEERILSAKLFSQRDRQATLLQDKQNKRRNNYLSMSLQQKKRVINTDLLTCVPVRGKLRGTRDYIRKKLYSYADNDHFAFTRQPLAVSLKSHHDRNRHQAVFYGGPRAMPSPRDLGYRPFVVDSNLLHQSIEYERNPSLIQSQQRKLRGRMRTIEPIKLPDKKKKKIQIRYKKAKKKDDDEFSNDTEREAEERRRFME